MATLKGQNLRIFVDNKPIALSQSCTVTLNSNTEESGSKEDVDGAARPEIVSKGWSVNVDSLSVMDIGRIISVAKSMKPVTVTWDETTGLANSTPIKSTFARTGSAYINDLNFSFNDRANSTKSIQLAGTGELKKVASTFDPSHPGEYGFTKGQFIRLFLIKEELSEFTVVAAARSLSFHLSISLETNTTKDTVGDWIAQEPTGYSFDISSNALVRSGEKIDEGAEAALSYEDIEEIYKNSKPIPFEIANTHGANNREMLEPILEGAVIITQLTLTASNKSAVTYDTQMQGYGELFVTEN